MGVGHVTKVIGNSSAGETTRNSRTASFRCDRLIENSARVQRDNSPSKRKPPKKPGMNKAIDVAADLDALSSMSTAGVNAISAAINGLLADTFALYLKTKNFHWHVSGRHFRDCRLLLDEQADAILATTDRLTERVRKIGGVTIRSVGQIARLQTITDTDEACVAPRAMLRELMEDNKQVAAAMRKAHELSDETERRIWFLFEASRQAGDNTE
jgi:starvation-inducible DNA-binding protein